jgi:hypothetical protein
LGDFSDKDLELACEDLRKIEKELAFEVTESYKDSGMEDFDDVLLALQSLVGVIGHLCKDSPTHP